jgi:small-conductance mechanosensitive channel
MNLYIIPAALITALFITLFISSLSKRSSRQFAVFFILIFLAIWSGQLWITPVGPVTRGIAWIPLIVIAIFFTMIAIALLPAATIKKTRENEDEIEEEALGLVFWIILLILILSIATSYLRTAYFIA